MENVEKQEVQTNGTARIHLRPHHGVCLLNFRGEGYSDEFSRNMTAMKERLNANPEEKICITKGADDLCAKCPNRRGNACSSEHPPLFDENVLRMTGFSYGQVLTWSEFSHATEPISLYRLGKPALAVNGFLFAGRLPVIGFHRLFRVFPENFLYNKCRFANSSVGYRSGAEAGGKGVRR